MSTDKKYFSFLKYQIAFDSTFWSELHKTYLTKWQKKESLEKIHGFIEVPFSDREVSDPLPPIIVLDYSSFQSTQGNASPPVSAPYWHIPVCVFIRHYATPASFEGDTQNDLKTVLTEHLLQPLLSSTPSTEEEEVARWSSASFVQILLHTFVDSKNNKVYCREAFPAMKWSKEADQHRVEVLQTVVGEAIQHVEGEWCIPSAVQDKIRGAVGERARRGSFTPCIGLLHTDKEDGSVSIDFVGFSPSRLTRLGQDPSQRILLCYPHLSPVVYTGVLDYGMRNFLTVFRLALPQVAQLHLYGVSPAGDVFSHCDLGEGRVVDPSEAQGTGWVNRREPRVIPLLVEVEQKMRQNLLLLQWQRPELQLGELAACRALLLGAGSLGCQVASHLLMYGVRALTLVDCGRVDYNNLARQVLFTSEDAAQRRPKVEAAADGLRRVIPAVEVQTEEMRLPIPGDAAEDHDTITASIEKLIELVESHDVVFLLLDSYAGRWLPTLVAHAHGKPVINIALGFEEYLVMRHPLEEQQQEGVPCYFCNKVSLLRDNSRSATLDLQCTVTRPAVAGIAAALGVELLATAYQHPQQFRAPDDAETCLGRLYGMKRGTIRSGLEASALRERRNPYCVACSAAMTDAYRYEGGVDFLTQCIVNPLLPSQLMEEYRSVQEGTEGKENDSIQSFSSFSDA